MKTTVSVPAWLFEAANRYVERHGLSRSELYSRAVSLYLDKNDSLGVKERLDAVHGEGYDSSQLDTEIAKIQFGSIPTEKW